MSGLRVAYLVSQYPALSHAFVDREIAALRARGVEVTTFSVRAPGAVLTAADRRAAAATTVLKTKAAKPWVRAHLSLARRAPGAYLRSVLASQHHGRRAARSRLWQLFYWAEAVVLAEHLRAQALRHVHVHFANNAADIARQAVAIASATGAGPTSWSMAMHGPTEFADPVGFDLADKLAGAAFVACISRWCQARVTELAPTARTVLVRMGADLTRYRPQTRDRAAGAPLRVLFVGRLVPDKAPEDLVAALAGRPDVELVIAGDGPLRATLTAPGVRLLGPVSQEQLPDWYDWADVLALPSRAEGLPVVLMEALATGLAVVTTPVAGIPELVEDDVTGLLVPPGDRAALAAAIDRLRDPALRQRLGAAGRSRVLTDHDADTAAVPLLDALSGLLAAATVDSVSVEAEK